MSMRLISIVGARPQFIKAAPVCRAIDHHNRRGGEPIEHALVHTGQHYDDAMSEIFFRELELPAAAENLGVGSGPHGRQTGLMLERIEKVLLEREPDVVVVFGDTNSTVAGALAAAKLQVPVAHVEAGLRSFNRRMPEELNRIVADHVSDLLLAPTTTALRHLGNENLAARSALTGDVMYDAMLHVRERARGSRILERLELQPGRYGVVTLHRAENTDIRSLQNLIGVLDQIALKRMPLVFPVHPRTRRILESFPGLRPSKLRMIEPVGYLDMLALVGQARLTLTDSGGLQKDAFFLNCPCITLREETEWPETVEGGGNLLAGTDSPRVRAAVETWEARLAAGPASFGASACALFGDGDAAGAIVQRLLALHASRSGGQVVAAAARA